MGYQISNIKVTQIQKEQYPKEIFRNLSYCDRCVLNGFQELLFLFKFYIFNNYRKNIYNVPQFSETFVISFIFLSVYVSESALKMENLVVLVSWLSFRFYRCIFMQVVTQIYTSVLASNMQCIFQKHVKMQGNKKKICSVHTKHQNVK